MLEQELEIAQCEVATLKRLMQGKDGLVVQKSKALDLAKVFRHLIQLYYVHVFEIKTLLVSQVLFGKNSITI